MAVSGSGNRGPDCWSKKMACDKYEDLQWVNQFLSIHYGQLRAFEQCVKAIWQVWWWEHCQRRQFWCQGNQAAWRQESTALWCWSVPKLACLQTVQKPTVTFLSRVVVVTVSGAGVCTDCCLTVSVHASHTFLSTLAAAWKSTCCWWTAVWMKTGVWVDWEWIGRVTENGCQGWLRVSVRGAFGTKASNQ